MPKSKNDAENPVQQVAWTSALPNGGGSWGAGIRGTVQESQVAIDQLDAYIEEAKERRRAQEKLLKKTIKRAEAEARDSYSEADIDNAKRTVGSVSPSTSATPN